MDKQGVPGPKGIDWEAAKTEYVTTTMSYDKIGKKYGVSRSVAQQKGKKDGWADARRRYRSKTYARAVSIVSGKESKRLSKLIDTTNKAIDVVARAFNDEDQFNRYLVDRQEEYADGKTVVDSDGDEVTLAKRQWTEEKQFSKVDSRALKDLTTVLKDLTGLMRDYYNIPTEDQRQARKIAAERLDMDKRKADEGDKVQEISVVFDDMPDEWGK